MNHLKWMGHSTTIFDIQRNLRNDPHSCEVTLVAKGHSVRAHRFVLSSCSDLLRNLLVEVPMGQEATIVVPDIKGTLLDSVLAFIYMGETSLTSSNLSEFLEAINILGIKSAISFECNTATLAGGVATGNLPGKTITEIHVGQEELIEQDNMAEQKIEPSSIITEQQSNARDLEFLDVYNDTPNHKITYSIEHMPVTSSANEFILTENSGTFTLTQNPKLENASSSDSEKIGEMDDNDDAHIIEEYSSGAEPIIEIDNSVASANTPSAIATSATHSTAAVLEINPKMRAIKLKSAVSNIAASAQQQRQQQQHHHQQPEMEEPIDIKLDTSAADPISMLKSDSFSFSDSNETSLDLSVNAVINEGMSLQKAAQKFDISKTVLWRRVRKHPNYMKTSRENPVLSLAYERLKNGESLKNISRELDIPMSTLHRHKVRLAQQGRLPENVTFKRRDSNTKDELKVKLGKAVHACVHEGMSQNHAANLFDIPKSTLWRHLQKRVAEAELSERMEKDNIKEEVILS